MCPNKAFHTAVCSYAYTVVQDMQPYVPSMTPELQAALRKEPGRSIKAETTHACC